MSSKKNGDDLINFEKKFDPAKSNSNAENKDGTFTPSSKNVGLDKSPVDLLSDLVKTINLNNQAKPDVTGSNQNQYIENSVKIPDWLKDCETPFSWHLYQERALGPELVIFRSSKKLDELRIEEPKFSLQR